MRVSRLIVSAFTLAAFVCVGVATGTLGASAGQSPGLQRAEAAVTAAQVVPTQIQENVPLPKTPPAGIKVAWLACSLAACTPSADGFVAAAKALGWDGTVLTYSFTDPGATVQEAIQAGYKYILMTAISVSSILPEVTEAEAQGVYLFSNSVIDIPEQKKNGLYGEAGGRVWDQNQGKLTADWLIAEANGHAMHALVPETPVASASVIPTNGGQQSELKKNCPSGCSISYLNLSITQEETGQSNGAIVDYLKAHPAIHYLVSDSTYDSVGLIPALKTAGLLSHLKILVTDGFEADMKDLVNGTVQGVTTIPDLYAPWAMVDWVARLAENVPITSADLKAGNELDFFLMQTPKEAQTIISKYAGVWPGPAGYQSEFERLWKVNG